jgi:hypothetical protein
MLWTDTPTHLALVDVPAATNIMTQHCFGDRDRREQDLAMRKAGDVILPIHPRPPSAP